jgi:hypothetical protein
MTVEVMAVARLFCEKQTCRNNKKAQSDASGLMSQSYNKFLISQIVSAFYKEKCPASNSAGV